MDAVLGGVRDSVGRGRSGRGSRARPGEGFPGGCVGVSWCRVSAPPARPLRCAGSAEGAVLGGRPGAGAGSVCSVTARSPHPGELGVHPKRRESCFPGTDSPSRGPHRRSPTRSCSCLRVMLENFCWESGVYVNHGNSESGCSPETVLCKALTVFRGKFGV